MLSLKCSVIISALYNSLWLLCSLDISFGLKKKNILANVLKPFWDGIILTWNISILQRHHTTYRWREGVLGEYAKLVESPEESGWAEATGHVLQCGHAEVPGGILHINMICEDLHHLKGSWHGLLFYYFNISWGSFIMSIKVFLHTHKNK